MKNLSKRLVFSLPHKTWQQEATALTRPEPSAESDSPAEPEFSRVEASSPWTLEEARGRPPDT